MYQINIVIYRHRNNPPYQGGVLNSQIYRYLHLIQKCGH